MINLTTAYFCRRVYAECFIDGIIIRYIEKYITRYILEYSRGIFVPSSVKYPEFIYIDNANNSNRDRDCFARRDTEIAREFYKDLNDIVVLQELNLKKRK